MKVIITKGSQKGKILERDDPKLLRPLIDAKMAKVYVEKELKTEVETKELKPKKRVRKK